MSAESLSAAQDLVDAGISVIACDKATKRPIPEVGKWEPFQTTRPTREHLEKWFFNGACIAAIGGPVSGNLEFIDFDEPGQILAWIELLKSWNCGPILDKLVTEQSQRKGGWHVGYRHQGKPDGNLKLAMRPPTDDELAADPRAKTKALIETRGEGGYCIIAPSPGYTLKRGKWTDPPLLTAEEREALISAARTFDRAPRDYQSTAPKGRTGDAYNERGSVDEILIAEGWTRSGGHYWIRPGKTIKQGHSATWDHNGSRRFHVFTSSAGLEPGSYTLFALYAFLKHQGNFSEAAKCLHAQGYGQDPAAMARRMGSSGATLNEIRARTKPTNVQDSGDRKWFTYDEVEAKDIDWLIEPYLPLGIGYTLLFGDSDMGKSTALIAIIASLSNGIHPFTREKVEPVRSIILSAEDSATYVVKPRLQAFGANMRNIMSPEEFFPDGTPNPMALDEYGMEELSDQVRDFGAGLIIIDPLTSYFAGENIDNRLEARAWTKPITNMAIQCHCCPVIVQHVNKSSSMQARYRASNSQDFFDASRSALMAVRSQEAPDDYALTHEKHNLTVQGDSIGYTFSKERGFEWTGASDLTSDIVAMQMEDHVEPSKLKACQEFIMEQLGSGPMLANDLEKGAKGAGYSLRTYKRARTALGTQLKATKEGSDPPRWWAEIRDYGSVYRGD